MFIQRFCHMLTWETLMHVSLYLLLLKDLQSNKRTIELTSCAQMVQAEPALVVDTVTDVIVY
jgi:hypothetical protein